MFYNCKTHPFFIYYKFHIRFSYLLAFVIKLSYNKENWKRREFCVMQINLNGLTTESINPATRELDKQSAYRIAELINEEDQKVALAVKTQLTQIGEAIDAIVERMKRGGRLIYMGAGTSGRLGVVDASECPPTYGVSSDLVVGLIAGGHDAMFQAQENVEDSEELGREDLKNINVTESKFALLTT